TNYELSLTSPVLPYSGGGYSLDFDGNNDYVSMSNMVAPSGNDPRTFMAWIKRNNTSTSWPGQAIGGWGNDASNELMNILILDSVLYWHVNGGNSLTGSTQINPDTWYHITATYDGTTQRFYVDGILDGSNDWDLNTGSGNVKFGKQPDWPGAYFDGLINGGAIWNDALTPEEITTIYNSGNPFNVSNDLMAYWDFNDGTGTTVTDQSGNGNDGTVYGATWVASNEDVLLTYDFMLDNWSATGGEHLAVEYRDGASWYTLRDFANTADVPWDTFTDTIPAPEDNIQVRFRAYGENSFNLDGFIVDNVA
ncbi:uncharacterized protein METZ01_LOCUS367313, partial [marine metagenome]